MPYEAKQLRVGDLPPAAARVALCHEDAIWLCLRPMEQTVGEPDRIFAERDFRPEINCTVIAAVDGHGGIAERDWTQRGVAARRRDRHVGLCAHVRRGFT